MDFISVYLPYCLQKLEDGRYIVLNRDYKPLGFSRHGHYDYTAYPVAFNMNSLTSDFVAKLSWKGSQDTDKIFLYNGTNPSRDVAAMTAYFEKLKLLTRLQVDVDSNSDIVSARYPR